MLFYDLFKRMLPELNFYEGTREELNNLNMNTNLTEEHMRLEDIFPDTSKFIELSDNQEYIDFNPLSISANVDAKSGIYFLYNKDYQLVYVGQSINLRNRLLQHASGTNTSDTKKNFYFIKYLVIPEEEIDDYETYFINKHQPILNYDKVYTYKSKRYDINYNDSIEKLLSAITFGEILANNIPEFLPATTVCH